MKVFRDEIAYNMLATNVSKLPSIRKSNGKWYNALEEEVKIIDEDNFYILWNGTSVTTDDGMEFVNGKTYRLVPTPIVSSNEKAATYVEVSGKHVVCDIKEMTQTGKDMGERKITAVIKHKCPIDFKIGDYVELQMQDLIRSTNGASGGTDFIEKYYIYTKPSVKKTARSYSGGDAFEITVAFYPHQYELGCVQMRDIIQMRAQDQTPILYTGFDSVTFVGGAKMLMDRIMAVLQEAYHDNNGNPLWDYQIADGVNEEVNSALEQFQFSFSNNTVMDALMELNNKDTLNTTFFINDRTIYVGFKRPYFCGVNDLGAINTIPFNFEYGKTSHLPIDTNYGCLYDITKVVSDNSPITKLFAYGAARNLNRYYCSDRIKSGRFVNKLMLPSFDDDGQTDFILSKEGVEKFGIREGSKTFDDIYPSLRYMTYGDLRQIKYCIKIKGSGIVNDYKDADGNLDKTLASEYAYPVASVQCYKVTEGADGKNTIVECAPPKDMTIIVHATGKVVKCRLYGGSTNEEAIRKQMAADHKIPTTDGQSVAQDLSNAIPGACFCVHDFKYDHNSWADGNYECNSRDEWFEKPNWSSDNPDDRETEREREIELAQIEYVDTFWLTDLYWFDNYKQTSFNRDGVSAWCWARTNNKSQYPDETIVNEIIAVEPIKIVDTSLALSEDKIQKTFDVYLKDVGFRFDEQNDFGEMVFVYDDIVLSFLDGQLCGREYKFVQKNQYNFNAICAYNDDGTINDDFFIPGQYEPNTSESELARKAFMDGAYWRVTCMREVTDDSLGLILPMKGSNFGEINAKKGDHVVFLDLYMPDIYIHAAENRLLREAKKFLDANDNCETNYTINFDKVRPLQIPLYGIQMREGLNVRLVDNDLELSTIFNKKVVYDSENGMFAHNNIGRYTIREFVEKSNVSSNLDKTTQTYKFDDFIMSDLEYQTRAFSDDNSELFYISTNESNKQILPRYRGKTLQDTVFYIQLQESRLEDMSIKCSGGLIWQTCKELGIGGVDYKLGIVTDLHQVNKFVRVDYPIDFIAGKHYTIILDETKQINGQDVFAGDHSLTLVTSTGDTFVPECTITEIQDNSVSPDMRRFKFEFDLEYNFNDNVPYYINVEFLSDYEKSESTYAQVILYHIEYQNIEAYDLNENCIDMKVESVTVKFTETNDARHSFMNRKISATLKETTKASVWTQLNSKIDNASKEIDYNRVTYESLANTARQHYRELLMLRDSIFDPDGKCDQTFLHVMMMQVGADSMNYGLYPVRGNGADDYTHQDNIGVLHWGFVSVDNSGQWAAQLYENNLKHYVFTDGQYGGNWIIGRMDDVVNLGTNDSKPAYFVALKCNRTTNEGEWVIDTNQHMTDEDPDYWYFNFGIISYYNGEYHLSETRGNAYMYGDNLIAGKISSMEKNCWFDLTRGEFVLGNTPNGAALSFVNGVLTVKGVTDAQIGGENLYPFARLKSGIAENVMDSHGDGEHVELVEINSWEIGMEGEDGHSFKDNLDITISCRVTNKYRGDGVNFAICSYHGNVLVSTLLLEWIDIEETKRLVALFNSGVNQQIDHISIVAYSVEEEYPTDVEYVVDDIMVQLGTKATEYKPYTEHAVDVASDFIREAIQGSTEVKGGLVSTNILALKDSNGVVNAGMSGLRDDGQKVIEGQTVQSQGVTLWSGGSYENALKQAMGLTTQLTQLLPVLITKTGIGSKIGCFEVIENGIKIITQEGYILINNLGIYIYRKEGSDGVETYRLCVSITPGTIELPKSLGPYYVPQPSGKVMQLSRGVGSIILGNNDGDYSINVPESGMNLKMKGFKFHIKYDTSMQAGEGYSFVIDLVVMRVMGGGMYSGFSLNLGTYWDTSDDRIDDDIIFDKDIDGLFSAGDYKFEIRLQCTNTQTSYARYNITFPIESANKIQFYKDGGEPSIQIKSDGILVARNSGNYTVLKNDSATNTVLMAGLPSTDPHILGMLWQDGETIKASVG